MEDELRNQDVGPDDALFVNLILIFQGAAMQQMGKMKNPLTGKIERNLEQARFSIDTLAMLREKTRGNLSGDLERLLDSTLVNLRMNFVDESEKPAQNEAEPAEGRPAGAAPGGSAAPDESGRKEPGPQSAEPGGKE